MAQKPSIPKGTRDFSPKEMMGRNYIFDTIRSVFNKYGYLPIETPSMENLSTLLGKYGEEGDKLLFRVLNSGDFLSKVKNQDSYNDSTKLASKICEKGLRYDLTVPFARFVVQHRNEINFPFKRYQIQPVWRADRPQKGRYREFYQCDVDVIGSNGLLNEVELIRIVDEVFINLGLNITIKLNNRKILSGIAEYIGEKDHFMNITIAIDKIDKIGLEGVNKELEDKGISKEALKKLQPILDLAGTNEQKIERLKSILKESETGLKGLAELEEIFMYLSDIDINCKIETDLSLARGLNYYTGAIIEVKSDDVQIGSICGGGRYDDLTGIFGLKDISGVGVSFGADRIYDVLQQLNKFESKNKTSSKLMFVNFGTKEASHCLSLLGEIQKHGISAELYPDSAKMKKQMSYANDKSIPYVALVGENEINNNQITVKNMETGEQKSLNTNELIKVLQDTTEK